MAIKLCENCRKDLGYKFLEFREVNIIPTENGGEFPTFLIQTCSLKCQAECLTKRQAAHEKSEEAPF